MHDFKSIERALACCLLLLLFQGCNILPVAEPEPETDKNGCWIAPPPVSSWDASCQIHDGNIEATCRGRESEEGYAIDCPSPEPAPLLFDNGLLIKIANMDCTFCEGYRGASTPNTYDLGNGLVFLCQAYYRCVDPERPDVVCEVDIGYNDSPTGVKSWEVDARPEGGRATDRCPGLDHGSFEFGRGECTPKCDNYACGWDGCNTDGCGTCGEGKTCITYNKSGVVDGEYQVKYTRECVGSSSSGNGDTCDAECARYCQGARACLEGCGC